MQQFLGLVMAAVDGDAARLAAVLAGVRAYQAHPYQRAPQDRPVVARCGAARLLDYGGSGPPVVFVPSLINPPTVLDLAEENSLLRWLSGQGVRSMLVDWGTPAAAELALDIDGYVTKRLLPLLGAVGERVALAGYCLGGTMAVAAAALHPVTRLAMIATPWRFAGYDAEHRRVVASWWQAAVPVATALGALPMDLVQPLFWGLDPRAASAKFAAFARMDPDSPGARAFVALEDWANDGPPLAVPAARQCFEDFFERDAPGAGEWTIDGTVIDPAVLRVPLANFISTRDRIVPVAAAADAGTCLQLPAGHVGMVVGSQAKALLWEPLRDFLTG